MDTLEGIFIERMIVTHFKKRWPNPRQSTVPCNCEEADYPLMMWGITNDNKLCSMCPACREFQWGQAYDTN